jgi:hypothetical protein
MYVNKQLASKHNPRRRTNYYVNFAEKVTDRADGVFLWVCLVVPTLRKAINRGDTEAELELLLEQTPQELKELYKSIIEKIDKKCLRETVRMLQIGVLVERPLYLDEFQHAIAFSPNSQFMSLAEWNASPEATEQGHMVIARIQSRSGGLLEVCNTHLDRYKTSHRRRHKFKNHYDKQTASVELNIQTIGDSEHSMYHRVIDARKEVSFLTTPPPKPDYWWNDSQFIYSDDTEDSRKRPFPPSPKTDYWRS